MADDGAATDPLVVGTASDGVPGRRAARMGGLAVQLGSMVESSIGSAAGYHVAAAWAHVTSTGLTGPLLFNRDVGDLTFDPPTVRLPAAAGLGLSIDRDALSDLRVAEPVTVS